jgi:hypothetical protein
MLRSYWRRVGRRSGCMCSATRKAANSGWQTHLF